jgi:ketosteroid isomerase-like protein
MRSSASLPRPQRGEPGGPRRPSPDTPSERAALPGPQPLRATRGRRWSRARTRGEHSATTDRSPLPRMKAAVSDERDTACAMAQENVEIVKAAFDAYSRSDWDALLKDLAPDFEFDLSRSIAPQRGVYGREQLRKILGEFGEGFESMWTESHEFIEVGQHVIVPVTAHMVGRDGIEVQARTTWTWTIRDGAIGRVCLYQERAEALEAAGLSA